MRGGALLLGLLFGAGLLVSGMANPAKVQGFLDVGGQWDATLTMVMAAAVLVSLPAFQWAKKRSAPLCQSQWHAPTACAPDHRLMGGSVLFGIGWGMAGICPGSSLVLLGLGKGEALVFVVAMLLAMWLWPQRH